MLMHKKNKKERYLIISSFLVGCFVMLGGMIVVSFMKETTTGYKSNHERDIIYEKNSLSSSVDKIYDAVVVVENIKNDSLEGTGTGFIYKKDNQYGYILTNEHVISESTSIKVINTKEEEIEAKVLGKDEYLDLAVLTIPKKYVPLVATIGSSENMNLGDTIFTVGSP